jgi:hypothetical protein
VLRRPSAGKKATGDNEDRRAIPPQAFGMIDHPAQHTSTTVHRGAGKGTDVHCRTRAAQARGTGCLTSGYFRNKVDIGRILAFADSLALGHQAISWTSGREIAPRCGCI